MQIIHKIYDKTGSPVLILAFIILFILESKFELRKRVQWKWKRVLINGIFSLPAFAILRLFFIPVLIWLAEKNQQWHFGLNSYLTLSSWIEFGIGFLLLDYFIYVWHWLTHKISFLWRFHKVHHTDRDLDLTTAVRFHFGELFISVIFRGGSVLLVGVSPMLVLVYEIIFELATNFHHSNWKLPLNFEKLLNKFVVTPRMHGIHHSIIKDETDSNFSTIFSCWDRLHTTMKTVKSQNEIIIGLPDYQSAPELTVWQLFMMPFRK